uniref:Uncharacterized protein LOC114326492 isoform X1 n=1 Tax=Diabrotica virgifera virgifera TaxID=50390 RepID=A0A6P7F765_DIAVI
MTGSQACCPAACQPCADCPMPPHPICCMSCPPPIVLPTVPEPVKPLMMPVEKCEFKCSNIESTNHKQTKEEYDQGNFYNNWNIDYRDQVRKQYGQYNEQRCCPGITLNTQRACCGCELESSSAEKQNTIPNETGCPFGYQPCLLKLLPPPDQNPCGAWCAELKLPRPGTTVCKDRKKENTDVSKTCQRPCCKHWKSKEGECKYDLPCKAHCYNHPVGMKPKHHVPTIDYDLLRDLGECMDLK